MRASFKIDPATLITEVLTIVVGILLALAANEWNNQRLQHNKLEAILQIVAQELEYNQKVLTAIHARNASALAILEKDNDEEDGQIVPGLQVRATAWQTLLSSGVIENLSLPLLKALHEHYAMIEVYRTLIPNCIVKWSAQNRQG